jgi:transaldolase
MNPLEQLADLGQSPWLDDIHRGMLISGELTRLIGEGVRGLTSNPAIFEKSLTSGAEYDADVQSLAAAGKNPEEIGDALTLSDIRAACDAFGSLFEESEGSDGFVSIEVSPRLAKDTRGTVREARRLWREVARPNVMVKIPATAEGVPAIEAVLADGIPVNATLLFSVERYREVLEAHRRALEMRARDGKPAGVPSVASFFVSRMDTAVDKLLQERIRSSASGREKDQLLELLGKIAVAYAKTAYQAFRRHFDGAWFRILRTRGARPQRLLWASTGTKNPHYPDLLYVETLIGPDTVNTLPPATLAALLDHGKPRISIEEELEEARELLERLALVGVNLKEVTTRLEAEGVAAFQAAHDRLLAALTAKKNSIGASLAR